VSDAAASVFPLGPDFAGRRYALLGLARSGLATVAALRAAGAKVVAWDDREDARAAGAELGATIAELDDQLAGKDALILSPGVPLNTHPLAAAARATGVPIIGDIELFARARKHLPPHKVVGITGTNGKSTTTALIHHMLKTAGVPTLMGGNIGLPILSQQPLPAGGVYVLELSSYQIDLTFSLDCDVAVLLNVTPDHLDRYDGSFEAYRASKLRLFAMQSKCKVGILAGAASDEDIRMIPYHQETGPTRWVVPGERFEALKGDQPRWPALQGPHNLENAWASLNAVAELGINRRTAKAKLASYRGLPHRMERIATVGDILFVNDSKATNPEAAAPALAAYSNIHWILGGLAKGATLGDCAQHYANVAHAYLIGTAAAKPGDVVLLSPAAASFDQFRDFEARGDAFRDWVNAYAMGEQA
jgi:UDP-N-acetylmuramoylalanine--D-glutamate ligase